MSLPDLFSRSVYGPEFYRGLLSRRLPFSLRYFFALASALALAVTLILAVAWGPGVARFLHSLGPRVAEIYPPELVVTFRDGQASVNVAEPYFIPMPGELREGDVPENLLVIDTQTQFSTSKFREYGALFWLTREEIAWGQTGEEVRIRSLAQIPNMTVDRAAAEALAARIRGISAWAVPGLIFFLGLILFAAVLAAFVFDLVYLFFGAILVWAIARIYEWRLSYGKAYQLGIHAMSLGVLLQAFVWLGFPPMPFAFTLLLILTTWLNLSLARSKPQAETDAPRVLEPEA